MDHLIEEIVRRWEEGTYVEQDVLIPNTDFRELEWEPYEEYMRAKLVRTIPGEKGELVIEFPAHATEDNRRHIHPISDRVILVVLGSGKFVAVRNGQPIEHDLYPGMRVYMPRGTLHTFFAGPEGMRVWAIHTPWVPLEDPQCLVYPDSNS